MHAEAAEPLPDHVLQQEYDLVKNAFYTEPHDQSSWLYLRWLVGNSLACWEKAKGTDQEPSARQVSFVHGAAPELEFGDHPFCISASCVQMLCSC